MSDDITDLYLVLKGQVCRNRSGYYARAFSVSVKIWAPWAKGTQKWLRKSGCFF